MRNDSDMVNMNFIIKALLFLLFSVSVFLTEKIDIIYIFLIFEFIIVLVARVPVVFYLKIRLPEMIFLLIILLLLIFFTSTLTLTIIKFVSIYFYLKTMLYFSYKKSSFLKLFVNNLIKQNKINKCVSILEDEFISKKELFNVALYKTKKQKLLLELKTFKGNALNFYGVVLLFIHLFLPILSLMERV